MACRGSKVYPVGQADITGEVTAVPTGIAGSLKYTSVEITDTEWRPIPPIADPDRITVALQNPSGVEIRVRGDAVGGYTDNGMPVGPSGERQYQFKSTPAIYARSSSGTFNINCEELIAL